MMEHEQPAKRNELAQALHRRVDHLVLSSKARGRILAAAPNQMPGKAARWPNLAWAAAACLLIGVFVAVQMRTPATAQPSSYIKCVAVVFGDDSRADWLRRTVIAHKTNGTESFIKITAYNPQPTKDTIL